MKKFLSVGPLGMSIIASRAGMLSHPVLMKKEIENITENMWFSYNSIHIKIE
jgi:hypothetical protein